MAKETLKFEALLGKVQTQSIGRNAINMAATSTELLLDEFVKEDDQEYVYFKTAQGKRYRVHIMSFAAMRIKDKSAAVSAKWSSEIKSDNAITTLQDYVLTQTDFSFEKGMKFTVGHRVPIQDTFAEGKKAQLVNNSYKGINAYILESSEISASKDTPEDKSRAYQAARIKLYQTGVADPADYDDDTKVQKVPVFFIGD